MKNQMVKRLCELSLLQPEDVRVSLLSRLFELLKGTLQSRPKGEAYLLHRDCRDAWRKESRRNLWDL